MNQAELYQDKNPQYYGVTQAWVSDLIPTKVARVLDVGCGNGATGAWLKSMGRAQEVHGVELFEGAAALARNTLDSVTVGSIEDLILDFPPQSFDCIIATEVFEHLINPWDTVRKLSALLREGGYLIASSPNVRHYSVLWNLTVRGRWRYTNSGIMDKSHLRFFTHESFADLFVQAGLSIVYFAPIMHHRIERLNQASLRLFEGILTHRYKCKAIKQVTRPPLDTDHE